MISAGVIEQRSCLSKVRHGTKEEARAHARRLPKRDGRKAQAYRCAFAPDHSPHYHAGHNFKDRKGRLKLDIPAFISQSRA